MKKMMVLPGFDGFYESTNAAIIDSAIESMAECLAEEEGIELDNAVDRIYDNTDFTALHTQFARDYVDSVNDEIQSAAGVMDMLEFESLQSPREYNFTTDRIFVNIDEKYIERIAQECSRAVFSDTLKSLFTSYDGFISSYSPDILDYLDDNDAINWRDMDHNTLSALFEAWAADRLDLDNNSIIEDYDCNGEIINMLSYN